LRRLFFFAALLAGAWLAFVGWIYVQMKRPPERFTATIAKLPMPAMMLFPFQTLWTSARAGHIDTGDKAPDFDLSSADRKTRVRLSKHHGIRPVVLVFGSYT